MIRTHDAGTLTAANVGETVTLAGWVARRRDHGGVAFIDLRESSGVAQVVIRDEAVAHSLRSEFCLKVVGEVALRPEGNANPTLASAADVAVFSVSDTGIGIKADQLTHDKQMRIAHDADPQVTPAELTSLVQGQNQLGTRVKVKLIEASISTSTVRFEIVT